MTIRSGDVVRIRGLREEVRVVRGRICDGDALVGTFVGDDGAEHSVDFTERDVSEVLAQGTGGPKTKMKNSAEEAKAQKLEDELAALFDSPEFDTTSVTREK